MSTQQQPHALISNNNNREVSSQQQLHNNTHTRNIHQNFYDLNLNDDCEDLDNDSETINYRVSDKLPRSISIENNYYVDESGNSYYDGGDLEDGDAGSGSPNRFYGNFKLSGGEIQGHHQHQRRQYYSHNSEDNEEEDDDGDCGGTPKSPKNSQQQQQQQQQFHQMIASTIPANNNSNNSGRRHATISTSTMHVTPALPTPMSSLKSWSVETYEFAKQFVFEKLGRSQRTSDLELEKKVETLKDTQRQFRHLYDLARHLYTQYGQVIYTQKILGEVLTDLSHKCLEDGLTDQFNITATTQRIMAKNGEALLVCLNVFLKSMSTLCNTTIEDTLNTVKELEASRLKYDAYRSYLEKVRDSPRDFHYTLKLQEAERNFTKHQAKYKRFHHDLNIKLKFLDENRIKVCQKHLHLFQRGFLCYINNNKQGMDEIMQQFNQNKSSNNNISTTSTTKTPTYQTSFLEAPTCLLKKHTKESTTTATATTTTTSSPNSAAVYGNVVAKNSTAVYSNSANNGQVINSSGGGSAADSGPALCAVATPSTTSAQFN